MDNWEQEIAALWRQYGNIHALGQSRLALEPACQPFLWGMTDVVVDRGFAVRTLLRAGLWQFSAEQQTIWTDHYIQQQSAQQCAKKFHLSKRAIEMRLAKMRTLNGQWMAENLSQPLPASDLAIVVRYEAVAAENQPIAQYLSLLQKSESPNFLRTIADSQQLANLRETGIVQRVADNIMVHTKAREWLRRKVEPDRYSFWQRNIATQYKHDFLTAVYHWQQAEEWETAIRLLWAQRERLTRDDSLAVWQARLAGFVVRNLSAESRTKYNLLKGRILQRRGDAQDAIATFEAAQMSDERIPLDLRLEALYRLAHAHQEKDAGLAEFHLGRMLELGEQSGSRWMTGGFLLLAWLRIEQHEDFAGGRNWLKQARAIADDNADFLPHTRSSYHNTWAEYHRRNKQERDCAAYIRHSYFAHQFGLESADPLWRLQMQYNLGLAYLHCQRYDEAYTTLERNYGECTAAGADELAAKNRNAMASWWIYAKEDYAQAIQCGLEAQKYCSETNNARSFAATCVGLVYAYMQQGEAASAKQYFEKGRRIAQQIAHTGILKVFAWHENEYVELRFALSSTQEQALHYLRQHDEITNRKYRELTGVGNKKASNELGEMEHLGILVKTGKGRGVTYRLAAFVT